MEFHFLDDTIITSSNVKEHLENLDLALEKLISAGVRLNIAKCVFKLSMEDTFIVDVIDE